MDNGNLTFWYGVQLGTKVSLWDGFAGDGHFFLKLWTDRPKMKMEQWARRIGKVKRAADQSGAWSWKLGARS